jgi:hypothetical protein
MSDTATDIPPRVAVLEEIARNTLQALIDIRAEMREMRRESRADYRWLLGIMLAGFAMTTTGFAGILAVMAHGFHWL